MADFINSSVQALHHCWPLRAIKWEGHFDVLAATEPEEMKVIFIELSSTYWYVYWNTPILGSIRQQWTALGSNEQQHVVLDLRRVLRIRNDLGLFGPKSTRRQFRTILNAPFVNIVVGLSMRCESFNNGRFKRIFIDGPRTDSTNLFAS